LASAPDWSSPWRVEVHHYLGTEWELVGAGPAYTGEAVATPIGLAKDDQGTVFVAFGSAGQVRLRESTGSGWQDADPVSPDADDSLVTITSDRSGRVLALTADDRQAQVHRRTGDGWQQLGDTLAPTGMASPGDLLLGQLAVNCANHVAASFRNTVFLWR